jgi:hypothetical protein
MESWVLHLEDRTLPELLVSQIKMTTASQLQIYLSVSHFLTLCRRCGVSAKIASILCRGLHASKSCAHEEIQIDALYRSRCTQSINSVKEMIYRGREWAANIQQESPSVHSRRLCPLTQLGMWRSSLSCQKRVSSSLWPRANRTK